MCCLMLDPYLYPTLHAAGFEMSIIIHKVGVKKTAVYWSTDTTFASVFSQFTASPCGVDLLLNFSSESSKAESVQYWNGSIHVYIYLETAWMRGSGVPSHTVWPYSSSALPAHRAIQDTAVLFHHNQWMI